MRRDEQGISGVLFGKRGPRRAARPRERPRARGKRQGARGAAGGLVAAFAAPRAAPNRVPSAPPSPAAVPAVPFRGAQPGDPACAAESWYHPSEAKTDVGIEKEGGGHDPPDGRTP